MIPEKHSKVEVNLLKGRTLSLSEPSFNNFLEFIDSKLDYKLKNIEYDGKDFKYKKFTNRMVLGTVAVRGTYMKFRFTYNVLTGRGGLYRA